MDFGIFVPPLADSWKMVQRAEALGYSRAWFYDTQMLNTELFVAMTAAALNTSKIRLATGVLIPSNRIAPVAARALARRNALAPHAPRFQLFRSATESRRRTETCLPATGFRENTPRSHPAHVRRATRGPYRVVIVPQPVLPDS